MLAPSEHRPTDEQLACVDLLRTTSHNVLINAFAGTGKTATLKILADLCYERPIQYLVFARRNKDEAEKEFPSWTKVQTFNGCGHRVWGLTRSTQLKMSESTKPKLRTLTTEAIADLPKSYRRDARDEYWNIVNAVSMAKCLGYIPKGKFEPAQSLLTPEAFHATLDERPTALCKTLIDTVLIRSINAAYEGWIDFDDQIYMPTLFGGTFPRFPLVLVDEVQDLNPVNHAMLDKLGRNRVVAVGDPWQSIYGFRGAVQSGMQKIKERFNCQETTLSISFRCPQRIVENARWRVPNFRWFAEGGLVAQCRNLRPNTIADDAAVISRNNAPLFALAFRLLAAGRSVSVAGSDIGPRVVGTMRKLGDEGMAKPAVLRAIAEWREVKLSKGSTTADDMAACMVIFAEHGDTLGQAVAYAQHLFEQKGRLRLLTGHKAKGLEFDIVYHLDPWLIGDEEQELNLRYVIQTRAKREYYEVNSKDIRWP